MWFRGVGFALVALLLCACGPSETQSNINAPDQWSSVEQLLAARRELRAYDGAPPVIPHSVTELGRSDCGSCHTPGSSDTVTVAPPRSHPAWGTCTQCHVEQQKTGRFQSSTFEPLWWPASGTRQSEIAPPTIPHHIQNRENCAACHIGQHAPSVLRAAHGMRPNCTQCHIPISGAATSR